MARRSAPRPEIPETLEQALCRRAVRFRRRGEDRKAMVALREAALGNDQDARLWTLYGVQCLRIGRTEIAHQALSHAAWLRERRGEFKKARVTRNLGSILTQGRAA